MLQVRVTWVTNKFRPYISLIPACNHSGRELDAEIGPKVTEQPYRQSLSHDVRELVYGGDMEDVDLPLSNLLADEVEVNLDVLRVTVVNRIDCHVDCTNVVAIDNGHRRNRDMELLKQLSQPATLNNCMCNSPILRLCTGDTIVCRFEDQKAKLSPRKM